MLRTVLLLSVLTGSIWGQHPAVRTGFESAPLAVVEPLPAPTQAAAGPADYLTNPSPLATTPWQVDLLIGLPSGVRVQRELIPGRIWAEAGAGVYVIVGTAFVGLRGEGRIFESASTALLVRPGVDAYYVQGFIDHDRGGHYFNSNTESLGAVAIDIDFQWRQRWTRRFHGLATFKIGAGCTFGSVIYPFPILGVGIGGNF
jgi:hypothetical protein